MLNTYYMDTCMQSLVESAMEIWHLAAAQMKSYVVTLTTRRVQIAAAVKRLLKDLKKVKNLSREQIAVGKLLFSTYILDL
jgi:hypothetical protein